MMTKNKICCWFIILDIQRKGSSEISEDLALSSDALCSSAGLGFILRLLALVVVHWLLEAPAFSILPATQKWHKLLPNHENDLPPPLMD